MERRGATRDELYEAVADEVAHALSVLHGGLFGYDPEPSFRRHRAAASGAEGRGVSRALHSAAAAAGPLAVALESFPERPLPSGFAASASASATAAGVDAWAGEAEGRGQQQWGAAASQAAAQGGEEGDRWAATTGALTPQPVGGRFFFPPPQDDLWWRAAHAQQALQWATASCGVVPPPPLAVVDDGRGPVCFSSISAADAAAGSWR